MSDKWRILVVEDRDDDRELIGRELTRGKVPAEVRYVGSRSEFVAALKSYVPHLVISDFSLPQFDGLEGLAILQRYRTDIPFILVTGAQSEEVAVECMKRGADDYILKSSLKRLPSAVMNALGKKNMQREKEKTEAELIAREEQYRLIAEHSRDLIYLLDQKGQFYYASPSFQKILGYTPSELVGRKAFSLLHAEDRARARKSFEEALESGTGRTMQYRCKHKDGSWVLLESGVSWATDASGAPLKAVVVSRDIGERKRLEEQVRHAQKMEAVGRLAGGVAHDFNNLLTAMNGYADLLMRSLDLKDPRRADVTEIKETVGRAAVLTQQLLAFSRKQVTKPMVLDLNQVVSTVEKMVRRLIGEDVQLRTHLAPDLVKIRADVGQVEQILLNLSVNSRDAMPKGGSLEIRTTNETVDAPRAAETGLPEGAYAVLLVRDTGCGMDKETLAHLFEPFFTTKTRGRGTGLGLSTVYGIVQQSNGHIRVESVEGEGTEFRMYFPPAVAVESPVEGSAEMEEFLKGTETLLLVEDDRSVRTMAGRVLVQSGFRVVEAASGEEALQWLDQNRDPIDLLVTDVVMNGISGLELSKRVVAQRPGTRVLYLSGYMESDTRNSILAEVASSFLGKPFRPRDLIQKIRETLDAPPPQSAGPAAAKSAETPAASAQGQEK